MKKIKEFNNSEIQIIQEIWKVECSHLDMYDAKHQCPVCKKKFKRVPDIETFRKLTLRFNATDTAWAKVFKTDRSSVTKIRNKFNPKTKESVWSNQRFSEENKFYHSQDKKPIEDFLNLLKNYPRSSEKELLKIAEISNEYLQLVLNSDSFLYSQYNYIKEERFSKNYEYLYCVKCKVRKNKNKFDILEKGLVYAKICTFCADENLKLFIEYKEKGGN